MAKAKELEPVTPTEEQLRAMRYQLERNLGHNIAWIDGGEAFSCASTTLHPNSKAAKIVRSGLCLRWDREKVQRVSVGATDGCELSAEYQRRIINDAAKRLIAASNPVSAQGEQFFGVIRNVPPVHVPSMQRLAPSDPYAEHTRLERERNYTGLTFEHADNVRARKVAALRESLSVKFEPRFPSEGRSDRVYAVNQERR